MLTSARFVVPALAVAAFGDLVVGGNFTLRGDHVGHCELSVNDDATSTTVDTQNTWVEIADTLTLSAASGCTEDGSDVTIGADLAGTVLVNYAISFSGGTGKTYEFLVSKNDSPQLNCMQDIKLAAADVTPVSGVCTVETVVNDVLKLEVQCNDVTTANIVVREVSWVMVKM